MVFLLSLCFVAYALTRAWVRERDLGVRLAATCIVFCWLLNILFSLLMTARMFAPLPATLVALVAALAVIRTGIQPATCARSLTEAWLEIRHRLAGNGKPMSTISILCFVLFVTLLTVRVLALPLLGWDTMTYHGVKAGLWIQAQGWTSFEAPGGWEYYWTFLGGGELFTAWSMLFFHSDLLAGIPDVAFWCLCGIAVACLGRELGMQMGSSAMVAMAFLTSAELSRLVGSGYVDTCGTAFLLLGVLFLTRFDRERRAHDLCLAAAAVGIAASAKINFLMAGAIVACYALVSLVRCRAWSVRTIVSCIAVFAVPILPWLLLNWSTTGYPLGCVPLSLGPLRLGTMPPNLEWMHDRPDLTPYDVRTELVALFTTLRFFGISMLLALLGMPGVFSGARRPRPGRTLVLLVVLAICAMYFSPSFSVARVGWAEVNGRFLTPAVLLLAVAGLPAMTRYRHGSFVIEGLSMVTIAINLGMYIGNICHGVEIWLVAASIVLAALVCVLASRRPQAPTGSPAARTALIVAMIACVLFASERGKAAFRLNAYARCTTMHGFPRYWVPGIHALVEEPAPRRIAFAYGMLKTSHEAFLSPFLGAHLDNVLLYCSPDVSGDVVPHHPDYQSKAAASFDAWMHALQQSEATHVLCLRPSCEELQWAQKHPRRFTRLAGTRNDWGLFRIERLDE